jgi:hypothetical protein
MLDPGSIWTVHSEIFEATEANALKSAPIPRGARLTLLSSEPGSPRIQFLWGAKKYWTFEDHFRQHCARSEA